MKHTEFMREVKAVTVSVAVPCLPSMRRTNPNLNQLFTEDMKGLSAFQAKHAKSQFELQEKTLRLLWNHHLPKKREAIEAAVLLLGQQEQKRSHL